MKITDFKATFKDVDSAIRAAKIFELRKQSMISVMDGKFRDARNYQKEIAKEAVKDFEVYKKIPFVHFIVPGMPMKDFFSMAFNNFKFKIYSKFTKKTTDEKQFNKLAREYYSNLTKEDIKKNTIDVTIPSLF